LEIIVVDDASIDGTERVVRQYQDKDGRIKYIKNPIPKGGSGARNVGIIAAKGEYIAFLDDDDEWETTKIENQIKNIEYCDGVLCSCIVKGKNVEVKKYDKIFVDLNDLKKGNCFAGGASVLMARSSVVKDNLFDEKLPSSQDWDLWIRLAQKYKLKYSKDPLVVYNDGQHNRITNQIPTMSISQLEEQLKVIYKHADFLGSYWFNYNQARVLLSYVNQRNNKLKHIAYSIRTCGLYPVIANFCIKTCRNLHRVTKTSIIL
jgi:glycosyltransferase involved in cell wall biosynthesis